LIVALAVVFAFGFVTVAPGAGACHFHAWLLSAAGVLHELPGRVQS